MAKKYGIGEVNDQKESQNLCFFPEKTHGPFLQRHLSKKAFKSGPIKTVEGDIIGQHKGLPHYTVGQRKGLGIGGIKGYEHLVGQSWYVISMNRKDNALIVGQNNDLLYPELEAHSLSFVSGKVPENKQTVEAKIRARFPQQKATFAVAKGRAKVTFDRPQRAITPGAVRSLV